MKTINVHETKTHLSKHLKKVEEGESFIIARGNKPIAKLVPITEPDSPPKRRQLGGLEGKFIIPEDLLAFDREVDPVIEESFLESKIFPE